MVEDVAAFPVAARTVPFAPQDGQNLLAILAAVTATPAWLLTVHGGNELQEAIEQALFAAAFLNLGGEYSPCWGDARRDTCDMVANRLAGKAATWLGSNLPRFVYAIAIENLIVGASEVPA
jgi:hypothetical protein